MTQNQIEEILADYIRGNISPRRPEREMVATSYKRLQEMLPGMTFQNGSYARHTSTTPVNDLDVFYILPETVRKDMVERRINPEQLTLDNILRDLAEALQKEYGTQARVVVQPHSIGIFFGTEDDFSIDVVPAQAMESGLFWVPETALQSVRSRRSLYKSGATLVLHWIKSDPQGYISQATSLDVQTKGVFRKAAKFAKKWKNGCKDLDHEFPLKSFHIEIMVTELLKANPSFTCLEAVKEFCSLLPSSILTPRYADRADASRHIDEYVRSLTDREKDLVLIEHQRVAPLIVRIQSATSEAQVLLGIENALNLPGGIANQGPTIISGTRTSPAYSKPYLR